MRNRSLLALAAGSLLVSLFPSVSSVSGAADVAVVAGRPKADPVYLDAKAPIERRVKDLLGRMTLEEKVGQMTQAERQAATDDPNLITDLGLGSILSGGGSVPANNTPAGWVEMVNGFQEQALSTRLGIPIIYGVDAVHGHGNVFGATVFPHNIGLGGTWDPNLVRRIGEATAEEVRATGIPWNFSPCVCVARDERWGRTYESFGEDPALVRRMSTIIAGLQGNGRNRIAADHVLATPKHYAGDGDTEYDQAIADDNEGRPWFEQRYTIDQGITVTTRADFDAIDIAPYRAAIRRHHVLQRDAVVLQRGLDRGRRRQPAQDARPRAADHRRPQGRVELQADS